ncbi:hypothetical protein RND71_001173 [Anisodus tanguticus]|uniref:Uncharacterized protein n=1 Tax=Anisodus tanguticus TaxID=243964 RepID=A0AAE1T2D7_9SOLA|nr:hypothetical protein RND71_001173 [Anisodus tanguticus]
MATLSIAVGNCGKGRNPKDLSSEFVPHLSLGSEFLTKRLYGLNLKDLESPKVRMRKKFCIGAEIKKWKKHDYPWPGDIDPNTKTPLKYLSYFKPLDEKPKPVTLAFEKPLIDLEKQLIEAAEKLRITAQEHYRLRIADAIIPEPLGGAHADPFWASQQIKHAILEAMVEFGRMNSEQLLHQRMLKFCSIGGFQEGIQVEPERKRNMKPSEANTRPADLESELADLRKKILEAKGPSDPVTSQVLEKLQEDLDTEMTKAFITMGLREKIESLKLELQRAPILDQPLNKSLQEKANKIMQEFKQKLSQPGAYLGLKQKLHTVNMASRLIELKNKSKIDRLKTASEKLTNGHSLDTNLVEEVEKAKEELEDVLRSASLEIVGMRKRTKVAVPPEVEAEVAKVNEEIQRAVSRSGLSERIEELKVEIVKDSNSEKVKELEIDIREGIAAALNVTPVKKKVESLRETGITHQR